MRHNIRLTSWFAQLPQNLRYDLKSAAVSIRDFFHSQHVMIPLRQKQAISEANIITEAYRHAFPTIYILSIPYKDELAKVAFLPSLLFLSTSSSSRLMTLRFVTARAIDGFSTAILSTTHVLSPHIPIVNSILSKINLL